MTVLVAWQLPRGQQYEDVSLENPPAVTGCQVSHAASCSIAKKVRHALREKYI